MDYGSIHFRIEELLEEKGISKNQICKDLDIKRSNFNRYCKDENSRYDPNFICKLCYYLGVGLNEIMEYRRPE